MSKFKKVSTSVRAKDVETFIEGAEERAVVITSASNKRAAPTVSFLLKLEHDVHELLRGLAEAEDRSMQWMLRKMTAEAIRKRAEEAGIGN